MEGELNNLFKGKYETFVRCGAITVLGFGICGLRLLKR
jgi:hypothetical protein